MEQLTFNNIHFKAPFILGLMRINGKTVAEVKALLQASLDAGVNYFDHADIYGGGECEKLFAQAIKELKIDRKDYILQSKVGIRPGVAYDFTYEHIVQSVEGILKRLQTTYLDVLLLHRPDMLMEPEVVAKALIELKEGGKVLHFGVSNFHQSSIALLQKHLPFKLIINQMQLSVAHNALITSNIYVNSDFPFNAYGTYGLLNFMQEQDITLQAWSPLMYRVGESLLDHPELEALNVELSKLAAKYGVTKSAIAFAFILRHPAKTQVVLGTTSVKHLKEALEARTIKLTHDEWYALIAASGKRII